MSKGVEGPGGTELKSIKRVVAFRIDGRPSPWARARISGKRFFKSGAQVAAQTHIAVKAKFAAKDLFFTGPVFVKYEFYFQRPKKGKEGVVYYTGRPDKDNLEKQVNDSLNGVVWKDDAQVVESTSFKKYADKDFTWVEVCEL